MYSNGPNVSQDQENFFQSDSDIEKLKRRQSKADNTEGDPWDVSSKVLFLLPYNNYIITSQANAIIQVLSLENKNCIATLRGHSAPVTCLALMGNHHLVSSSWDKTLFIWDLIVMFW